MIEVEPGVYREALVVDTPNITLRGIVRGAERPVLDGGGEKNDGVIASGSPFAMSGFRVQHYRGNGVTTQGVSGVTLDDLIVDDAGLYGVYPVQSQDIRVTKELINACLPLRINVHDHIIIGRKGEASLRSLGLI